MQDQLIELPEWQSLKHHHLVLAHSHMRELFAEDAERVNKFSVEAAGLFLDYSKNRITEQTLDKLIKLAEVRDLPERIQGLFSGAKVNCTEEQPALHTALRNFGSAPLIIDEQNISSLVETSLQKMTEIVAKIHTKQWLGFSGLPITDVVNIGIGGSYLGPAMACHALTPYSKAQVNCHFVANIDSSALQNILQRLNPATTLFIVASKSFTTLETYHNTEAAKRWLLAAATSNTALHQHFIAITAHPERALQQGFSAGNILSIEKWVGGRYSIWSTMSLSLALAIGMDNFIAMLQGAYAMDHHFKNAPLAQNMPVILAMLGIWYINFFHTQTQAIIPYCDYLQLLPSYLQQLEMESNGKSIQQDGKPVGYATGAIIWGDVGTNGQHAFHQLLFQGRHLVPVDFIITASDHHCSEHHRLLLANCLAQSHALMEGIADETLPYKKIFGNQPSNTLMLPKLTPYSLGALLALYEHKVYCQSIIWNINCFDQWGVELGKQLAHKMAVQLADDTKLDKSHAISQGLLNYYQQHRKINS